MIVLLLGGNGLLGHNVLNQLLQQGHEVHALLRNPAALHFDTFPNQHLLRIFKGSLLADDDLNQAAKGCEAIINCAGVTDMSLLKYSHYLPVNRDLCDRLIELMKHHGINRLVHTSTANTIGYGTPERWADEECAMQSPFAESFYAQSKKEGEEKLQAAAKQHPDWHIIIVNPGFMIGSYDTKPSSGTLLLAGYRKPIMVAPKGGKSFIHVNDAATAIANALTQGRHGERYLLTGENLSLREFYHIQKQQCGYGQYILSVPNWLLAWAGCIGDALRKCGIQTQLSTRNVRQLMVGEYYDNQLARTELEMPATKIEKAIEDFFNWYLATTQDKR